MFYVTNLGVGGSVYFRWLEPEQWRHIVDKTTNYPSVYSGHYFFVFGSCAMHSYIFDIQ